MHKSLIVVLVAAASVGISDQLVKLFFVRNFIVGQSLPVLPNIFHLTYVQNTGAAFGILRGANSWLIPIVCVVLAILVGYVIMKKPAGIWLPLAFGSIIGGSVSNLLDRLTRGYVVDYFDFRIWPVFNIADTMINVGVAILLFTLVFRKKELT